MTTRSPARSSAAEGAPYEGDGIRVGISLLSQDRSQVTGTATYVRELLQAFAGRAEELTIQVLGNEHPLELWPQSSDGQISVDRARGFRVGQSRYLRMATLVAAKLAPERLSRQFSEDLQVVHYPLTLMVPSVHLPTVATVHDLLHRYMPDHFSRAELLWRRYWYEAVARRATIVITVSEHARGRIIESLDIAAERVVAIPNGVDHARFRPEPGADEEALVAGLQLPERYIFYPASLWRHKNHLALLDALARTGDDTLHLLLSGAAYGRAEEVMSHASRLGLDGRVRHLGTVPAPAIPVLYRRATAMAFPSSYEGFGLPPLEAMACGCPVASSRAAALAEVCGDATAVLEPGDPDQMARTLLAVAGDREVRRRLRERGLAQAKRFSWQAAADAHLAVYHRAAQLGAERVRSR